MMANDYLNQIRDLNRIINHKLDELSELRALAEKVTTMVSDMPGNASHDPHKNEKIIVQLIEAEKEVDDYVDRLIDLRRDAKKQIAKIRSMDSRIVLEKRYISLQSWAQIAKKMKKSQRQIFRFHKDGMAALERILEKT